MKENDCWGCYKPIDGKREYLGGGPYHLECYEKYKKDRHKCNYPHCYCFTEFDCKDLPPKRVY